jgi:hypothetical protein
VNIFFPDPNDPPCPPEEVRLRDLGAKPWPDGQRVKVFFELTPFQMRPSAEVRLSGPDGEEAAQVSILEAISRKMEFNLHLRPDAPAGEYTLAVTVYYQKLPSQEQPEAPLPEPLVVDRGQFKFNIPQA